MGYIYRYIDLADNIIKYVGIVWANNRTLQQRMQEHEKNDNWCFVRRWKVEYIETNINNRTEAEFFESHFITLYQTYKYFNIKKQNWGTSDLVQFSDNDWKEFNDDIYKENKHKNTIKRLEAQIEQLEESIQSLRRLNRLEYDLYISLKSDIEKMNKRGNELSD